MTKITTLNKLDKLGKVINEKKDSQEAGKLIKKVLNKEKANIIIKEGDSDIVSLLKGIFSKKNKVIKTGNGDRILYD